MLALAILGTGCGGNESSPLPPAPDVDGGLPDPEPGRVLGRFVAAARSGDTEAIWELLSAPTRASYGPSVAEFAATAAELRDDFEHFRPLRVALSRRLGRSWAVASLRGVTVEEDGDEREDAAYAAAFRRERAGWRVELGAVVFARLDPDPGGETEDRPALHAEAQAGDTINRMLMWLDGEAVRARPRSRAPFTAEVDAVPRRPLAEGPHVVVVFGQTAEGAGALAWPFEVD